MDHKEASELVKPYIKLYDKYACIDYDDAKHLLGEEKFKNLKFDSIRSVSPIPNTFYFWNVIDCLLQPSKKSLLNLTFNEFSKINKERCTDLKGFNHSLDSWSTSDWLTAVFGELGESANIIKKLNRIRDNIPGNDEAKEELIYQLKSELADTYTYFDLLVQSLGFSLPEIITETFNKKSKKIGYPEKFLE